MGEKRKTGVQDLKQKKPMAAKWFTWAFGGVFLIVFAAVLFDRQAGVYDQKLQAVSVLLSALFLCAALAAAAWLLQKYEYVLSAVQPVLLPCLFTVFFIIQLVFLFFFQVQPTDAWDFGVVADAAIRMGKEGYTPDVYFSMFPNNIPLFWFWTPFFKLLAIFGVTQTQVMMLCAGILNCLLIDTALYLLYRLARRVLGLPTAVLTLLLAGANTAFLLYGPIFYTDTVTMLCPIGILNCYVWLRCRRKQKRPLWPPLCAGITLAAVGGALKVTVLIPLVAVCIAWIVQDGFRPKRIVPACGVLACAVLCVSLLSYGATALMNPPDREANHIPHSHWIMMGLMGNGSYYDPDYQLTLSVPAQQRPALIRQEIVRRIKAYGPAGLALHGLHKLAFTWADGTYLSSVKVDWGAVDHENPLREVFYTDGKLFGLYLTYIDGLQLAMLGLLGAGAFLKSGGRRLLAARISIFGLLLFLLAWETRSRYLVNMLPVLLFLEAASLCFFTAWLREKTAKRRTLKKGGKRG